MAHAHWVTGGELGKGRGEPQWTVHCPQRGQQHNAGDGPGLKIRGQEVVPGPQSSQQEKQRPGQPRAGPGKEEGELEQGWDPVVYRHILSTLFGFHDASFFP